MQASSSAPAPQHDPKTNVPGPSIVPARLPAKRRTALWGVLLAVVLLAGGAAWYYKSSAQTKTGGAAIVTVPTLAVSLGSMDATIRVNGTVAAQNFVSLLAPRIMGSRGDFNRGCP
jgi:multidrug efflux pump subunit AcrA (membrane-fusion protein)